MEEDCLELRQLACNLADLRRDGDGKNSRSLAQKGLLLLLKLKQDHKARCLQAEASKDITAASKAQLEQANLQLQNLLYEKQYYEKEIRGQRSFKSRFSDEAIGLIPVEEFLLSAGLEDGAARAELLADDYKLTTARLKHEIEQRKALAKQLAALKTKKQEVFNGVLAQRARLQDLRNSIDQLDVVAKPLQASFSQQTNPCLLTTCPSQALVQPTHQNPVLRSFSRLADLLPLPLYIIYSQLAAAHEALGLPINLSISGSEQEAEALARSVASTSSSGLSRAMQLAAPHGSSDAPDQPSLPKRARLSPPAPCTDDLYKVHPLSVVLDLLPDPAIMSSVPSSTAAGLPPANPLISIRFQYLLRLQLVEASTAAAEDAQLLAALFPGDDGRADCYESIAQMQDGTFKFDPDRVSRPYKWCQHLAGHDFVPPLPLASLLSPEEAGVVLEGLDRYRRQQRVATLVERLHTVKAGNLTLKALLPDILRTPGGPLDKSLYIRAPTSTLVAWEEVTEAAAGASSGGSHERSSSKRHRSSSSHHEQDTMSALAARSKLNALAKPFVPGGSNTAALGRAATPPPPANKALSVPGRTTQGGEDGEWDDEEGAIVNEEGGVSPHRQGNSSRDSPDSHSSMAADGEDDDRVGAIKHTSADRSARGDGAQVEELDEGEIDVEAEEAAAAATLAAALAARKLEDQAAAATAVVEFPPPPSRLFHAVLRHGKALEADATVRIFLDYPVLPPLVAVHAVRKVVPADCGRDARYAAVAKEVEERPRWKSTITWMQQEANTELLPAVGRTPELLLHQLYRLRLCLDLVAELEAAQERVSDPAALTAVRQRLFGVSSGLSLAAVLR